MSLQGIVLIPKTPGEVDGDDTTFGCQVAGNFGSDFPFDIKKDSTAVKVDNLTDFRAGFAAAGGAEFDDVAKFLAFLGWLDGVHLPILPFADVQKFPVKLRDGKGVEFMFVGQPSRVKFLAGIQKDIDPAYEA
jgi:hypothetical protein